LRLTVSGIHHNSHVEQDGDGEQHFIDQVKRVGCECHQRRRAERADHQSDKRRDAVEQRTLAAVAVEDRRAECGGCGANTEALHGTR
jgi:hypothetical protein